MNNKHKTNWWIDSVIFAGFILAFFLDLTGLELHQWLGVLGGVFALAHLLLHWDWVRAIAARFIRPATPGLKMGRSRLYFILDAALFAGFGAILVSGLVISTWLNLAVNNSAAWLNFHIYASLMTLVVTLFKLALHWRWIAQVTRKVLGTAPVSAAIPSPARLALAPVAASNNRMGRKEFLQVLGVVGAASVIAFSKAAAGLETTSSVGGEQIASLDSTDQVVSAQSGTTTSSSQTETETVSVPAETATSACSVRCPRGCSFPGHCHKYQDSNNNNLCDYGECL